jgi:hypothetical protein
MKTLTDGQFWGMMAAIIGSNVAICAGFLAHWSSVSKDILRDEKKRLNEQAREYAEKMAKELFREYVKHIRINVPVTLVNESDIPWSSDANKEDAA